MAIKTHILTDSEPLDKILSGIEKLYKPVSVTMGPRGRNVIFKKYNKRVGVTHDGVTVAKLVRIDGDEAENTAADILREAALKLDSVTGDGTTTVTVLAYHIYANAHKHIKDGKSPMALKLELDAKQPEIISEIEKYTDKNVNEKKLVQVASVAAGSGEIGYEVGKLMFDAGADTPIMLGFSDSPETYSEVISGFKINSGPASPYLMNDAGVKLEIIKPYVVVVDAKLRDRDDVMPLLELFAGMQPEERRFLLVCGDIAGDALAYMVANRLKGFADIAVARVPAQIMSHPEYLSDLAVSCGATVLSRNTADSIKQPKLEHLGSADKVTIEPTETVIINGHSIKEDFKSRVEELKDYKKKAPTSAGRKFAADRLFGLEQKVVSIFVGGQSETEAEERHYRFEDAVGACRASLRGGVVPGGGTLFYHIAQLLNKSEDMASSILADALIEPMYKVWSNAGVEQAGQEITVGHGIDVMNPADGVIDLVERGILDPAESEIECIKTAISIAGLLITAGAMIVDEGEPDAVEQKTSFS